MTPSPDPGCPAEPSLLEQMERMVREMAAEPQPEYVIEPGSAIMLPWRGPLRPGEGR